MKLRNVIFYVSNIKKSVDFYKSLNFEVAQDFGHFISFKTDNEGLYFSIMQPDTLGKEPGKQVCCFYTTNIEKLYEEMKNKKVEIATELFTASFGKTFSIRDLDRNKIEFVES